MVGLAAIAITLGVMIFAARRYGVNGDDDDGGEDGEAEAPRLQRPPPGSKATPLKLSLRNFRGLRLADFRNNDRALRDFGELVTVAALASEGWKKLPSKVQGGQGLDVLVVRDVKGSGGYEARAIEVRTNDHAYNPAQMSDERVIAALGHLHDIGAFDAATLDELSRGVLLGAPFFRKELWHHQLDTGHTTVWTLDEAGERSTPQLRPLSAHLMDALYQMIKQLDHNADYVDRRPIEPAPPIEEVVLASARPRKPVKRTFMAAARRVFAPKPKRRA